MKWWKELGVGVAISELQTKGNKGRSQESTSGTSGAVSDFFVLLLQKGTRDEHTLVKSVSSSLNALDRQLIAITCGEYLLLLKRLAPLERDI